MSFKITARTILQLGAELISSDEVALFELIKNAIDAKSKSGVDIHFQITMLRAKYDELVALYSDSEVSEVRKLTAEEFRAAITERFYADAPEGFTSQFKQALTATTVKPLMQQLESAYIQFNNITVSDTGHGMSAEDLREIFLTIGTTSRAATTREDLDKDDVKRPTYLGEKGVGRLSAMRLGSKMKVLTATESDKKMNVLDIDWTLFEQAYDKSFDTVKLAPTSGPSKPPDFESGTTITVFGLRSSWTPTILQRMVEEQISKLLDPFSFVERRRAPIRIIYNGKAFEYGKTVSAALLNSAHGVCKGEYKFVEGRPILSVTLESKLYGNIAQTDDYDVTDLKGLSDLTENGLPLSSLMTVGSFSFELYWYNRLHIKGVEDVGDRETVRRLQKAWTGIFLFRDGYRVLPYGSEGDDWLMLDRTALGSPGYKLNTKQFIGRVRIGRLSNPRLLDQTNRQGLQTCPETKVLVHTLHNVVVDKFKKFIDKAAEAEKIAKGLGFDREETTRRVVTLEKRAKESLSVIKSHYKGPDQILAQVRDAFDELNDAYQRATSRLEAMESEAERMMYLAGIGLLVETVAHELTRATEHTQMTLKEIKSSDVSKDVADTFKSLSSQLNTITKRLRILEPLSVTARNRRSHMDLAAIVEFVMGSHEAQFGRHGVKPIIKYPGGKKQPIEAFVIEGMVVQILENLIANSVYWLKGYKEEHPNHVGEIVIELSKKPPTILYHDNGPGIPISRRDAVFEPFFSTKGGSGRHGLGLYIARQNAELMQGEIQLVDEPEVRKGRLNAFAVELREGADGK